MYLSGALFTILENALKEKEHAVKEKQRAIEENERLKQRLRELGEDI